MLAAGKNSPSGQTLAELVIALGIFAVLAAAFASMLLFGLDTAAKGREYLQARSLARSGLEAVRSIGRNNWNSLVYRQSGVDSSEGGWQLSGEGSVEQIGPYTRYIRFSDVYRGAATYELSDSGAAGSFLDVLSKKVSVSVEWEMSNGRTGNYELSENISAWFTSAWEQDNWQGGGGQEIWNDEDRFYRSDKLAYGDGNLSLARTSTSSYHATGSLESSAFFSGGKAAALAWSEILPQNCAACAIKAQIKTAPDQGGNPGIWTENWCGPDGVDGDADDYFTESAGGIIDMAHNGSEWIKYRLILEGGGDETPSAASVKVYYQ